MVKFHDDNNLLKNVEELYFITNTHKKDCKCVYCIKLIPILSNKKIKKIVY